MYEEASHFLIDHGDMQAATDLGGYYYGKKIYDLALKYYQLAADHGVPYAWTGLGYIWYYGRLGTRDYEKAYHCYAKVLELLTGERIEDDGFWQPDKKVKLKGAGEYDDYINAVYKLADMYRSGHYVEKNWVHYADLIRRLYAMMTDPDNTMVPDYHLPEIELRLAEILLDGPREMVSWIDGLTAPEAGSDAAKGKMLESSPDAAKDNALELLFDAKDRMAGRLMDNAFFGNFSIMKSIVLKIYSLTPFDPEECDLYDLYYVLRKPCRVTFMCGDERHEITAEQDGQETSVCLDGKWFHSVDDMMMKGRIDGDKIPDICYDCYDFSIESADSHV